MRKLLFLLLCGFVAVAVSSVTAEPILKPKGKLAILGDSITEGKVYTKYMEQYILACYPHLDIDIFQFGCSGERAPGFLARMDKDLSYFRPTAVTICYGMNDGSYRPYVDEIGQTYSQAMREIVEKLKAAGTAAVVGGPGVVDSKFFAGKDVSSDQYNENLATLSKLSKEIAEQEKCSYANLHAIMMEAMKKGKALHGEDFPVGGRDGVHPQNNGHFVMAYAFLKALGFDGDLGTITLDYSGKSAGKDGHTVNSFTDGVAEIVSSRWPFCFDGFRDGSRIADGALIMVNIIPFNEELNRMMLVVKNAPAAKMTVTWNKQKKTFTRPELEKGINLPAEFIDNPFCTPFSILGEQIRKKEYFETEFIRNIIRLCDKVKIDERSDSDLDAASAVIMKKGMEKWTALNAAAKAEVKPFTHTITLAPAE